MVVQLRVLSGKSAGTAFDLALGSSYLVGTRKANDIRLRDKGVGFKHAKIIVSPKGEVSVEDLGAKGGTQIDEGEVLQNTAQALSPGQSLRLGSTELVLELGSVAPVSSAASEPEPPASSEPEPAAAIDAPEASEPEPAAAADEPDEPEAPASAAREPLPSLTSLDELPDDVSLLKDRFRELERRYLEKSQEARAYEEALEASSGGGEGTAYDDGLGGFSESVSSDLEARVLELQLFADEQTAAGLEKDEEIKQLRREAELLKERISESKDRTERERQSIAEDILRGHERLEERKSEAVEARAEVAEFEELNAELLLETEDLKEKLGTAQYVLEQERMQRGQMVRERLVELRAEAERLEAANAELRTLVEAYEEKIDELDERVEELEGESEAHDALVADLRNRVTKTEQERDVMVKTLRKKLQAQERKLERLQGEHARARASSEAGS